jgi:hypothetical protein
MVRTHTLVEYRLKEFELEQALRKLKKQQDGVDYKLDMEFYIKLEALTKDYGYTFNQVFDLLSARYGGAGSDANCNVDSLKARTNTRLLEMIQRSEAASPSARTQQDQSVSVSFHRGNRKTNEYSSGRSTDVDHDLVASDEVDGHENGIGVED